MRSVVNERFLYEYSHAGHYKVAVCYPNSYHVGMSNLGFLSLYHFLSSTDGIKTERYFIDRDGKLYSPEINISKTSLNLGRKLSSSDILFFSVSFEMDYLNVIRMLLLSGVEPISDKRTENDPIVVIGGITITANPEPMSVIADILYLGDMEIGLKDLLELLFEHRFKKSEKLFVDISGLPGFYIKNISTVIPQKATEKEIGIPAHSVIITDNTVFSNRFLIEVARGCKNSCRFCMTRTSNFPPRSISKDSILDIAKKASRFTNLVGLIAPVVNDNDNLIEVVDRLNKSNMIVSFSSLRADRFTKELAEIIKSNKQSTVTFAPETGSDGLRRKIGKHLTNENILDSVMLGLKYGIKNIRYYFMYGLPFEEWEDIESILRLIRNTITILQNKGFLHLSINPFIPKKNTPFEKEIVKDIDYYNAVKNYLLENLKREVKNRSLSIRFESLKFVYTHFFLSIGNKKVGYYLADNAEIKTIGRINNHFKNLYYSGVNPYEY